MKPCFPLVCLTIVFFGVGCAGGVGSGLVNRSSDAKHGPVATRGKLRRTAGETHASTHSAAAKPDKKLASLRQPAPAAAGKVTVRSEPTSNVTMPATETPVQAPPVKDPNLQPASHTVADAPDANPPAPAVNPADPSAAMGNSSATATYGKADDYSWVQGRLTQVHSRGGQWEIRYADHAQTDAHGGRFVLAGQLRGELHDGAIVRIWGRVLGHDSAARGTAYRVEQLQVVRESVSPFDL